jgi:hypothetical protein
MYELHGNTTHTIGRKTGRAMYIGTKAQITEEINGKNGIWVFVFIISI